MTVAGKGLLQKLQRLRPSVEFPSDAEETLAEVHQFLSANMVTNRNDATHEVLANYSDWWDSQLSGPKYLAISDDCHVDRLHEKIGQMYDLGAPLTLGEKRSSEFKLMQEIEICGNKDGRTIDLQDLVGPKSKFLELIGKVMVELYPSLDSLHLLVLDGSGQNHRVGAPETFLRLVWTDVIVNKKRALGIFDALLKTLLTTDCVEVKNLERDAKELSEANCWKACLKDRIYAKDDPIQMVYNDSVSDPPLRKLQHRPLKPLYIYEFRQKEGQLEMFDPIPFNGMSRTFLAEIASIRKNGGTDLTPWVEPKGLVSQPQMDGLGETLSAANGAAPDRMGAEVRLRSKLSSPPGGKPPAPKSTTEEKQLKAERLFHGNLKDFVEQMKRAVGADMGEFKTDENEKRVVWTSHKSAAKIEFREVNRMVTFTGKGETIRHLLSSTDHVVTAVPQGYTGTETCSKAFTTQKATGSRAPSKVFEDQPLRRQILSSVSAISIPKPANSQNGTKVPYRRRVTETVDKTDPGDLQLDRGALVTVTEDPDAESLRGDLDRMVFGELESGETGWFCLGDTVPVP